MELEFAGQLANRQHRRFLARDQFVCPATVWGHFERGSQFQCTAPAIEADDLSACDPLPRGVNQPQLMTAPEIVGIGRPCRIDDA